ncbi:glycoside hydrolase [Treponema denticola]|uniref:Esterase n=1 Tax=Treponema denticola H-22 TaxID=999432 RepID=A0A0E2E4X0_TREDN|nr:alpha/beta hydrolase-fold protein [Treponema denticola]EMB31995.1 hypothetical protein HMPREF9726_01778 [Treponema denticola H-22]
MKKSIFFILSVFACVLSCTSEETNMNTILQNYTLTESVPKTYFSTAEKKGTVQLIEYATRDYTQASRPAITKKAYVYLPYGYNADDTTVSYNTLFYMHGWTGVAGELFTVGNGFIKNMFDVMIEKGDIQPLIIVAATFDNENASQNFNRSVDELDVFHNDFREALLPFIDSHFNTNASRNNRAFSGFSLGAVTTWYEFCYNNDLIKYFLPLSGDCWIIGTYGGRYRPKETTDRLEQIVREKRYTASDYEIYAAVGTRDPIWDQVNNQLTEMLTRRTFSGGNVRYAVKQGGRHDYDAIAEYLYNALPLYFGN